jgi:C-terminal processing protease CtpA/Prc
MLQRLVRLIIVSAIAITAENALAGETDRLVTLARIWSTVKYLDPAFVRGDIDLDAVLVRAIPVVRAAKSDDEFAAAVAGMLRELKDPATRVVAVEKSSKPSADTPLFNREGDLLVINAGAYATSHDGGQLWISASNLSKEIEKTKGLVIDLRTPIGAHDAAGFVGLLENLTAKPLVTPASRFVFHSGYAPQSGSTSGGYYSGFLTVPGPRLAPSASGNAPNRIAFVVDEYSRLPGAALALRDAGVAAIVSAVPVGDEMVVDVAPIKLDDMHMALVRTSQLLVSGITTDIVDRDPMAAARRFAKDELTLPPHSAPTTPLSPVFSFPAEREYRDMPYPDVNYRLLAAFRLWSIIDLFYPYKALIGDWDAVLREFIPRFIAAKDADDYGSAVREMDAHVEDGHSSATNLLTSAVKWPLPFAVRVIEGEYVITKLYDEKVPVKLGDIVVSIDGESMADRVNRLWKSVTASTEAARRARVANVALWGAKESTAEIEVRGAEGSRKVSVPRVARFVPPKETDLPYRVLDKNIGYADLTRLRGAQVEPMFEALNKTKAIIFDMRGYPNGTAFAIAPHINTKNARVGALFRRRQVSSAQTSEEAAYWFFFEQLLPKSEKPNYPGRTVTLIDERAISQSEHLCLFFEVASGTTFIGTPTAGANGDVTNFPLPGGFRVNFTGHDVRHADGRQLQRVGIQPDVIVAPTIAGIRAGRDEVLDRAIKYLNDVVH